MIERMGCVEKLFFAAGKRIYGSFVGFGAKERILLF